MASARVLTILLQGRAWTSTGALHGLCATRTAGTARPSGPREAGGGGRLLRRERKLHLSALVSAQRVQNAVVSITMTCVWSVFGVAALGVSFPWSKNAKAVAQINADAEARRTNLLIHYSFIPYSSGNCWLRLGQRRFFSDDVWTVLSIVAEPRNNADHE